MLTEAGRRLGHGRALGTGRLRRRVGLKYFLSLRVHSSSSGAPVFGGLSRGWQSACQALILVEVPTVPEYSPLLLAQKLPDLGKYAKDLLSASFPEDPAITDDFIPPALGTRYVCALNSAIGGEVASGKSVSISAHQG